MGRPGIGAAAALLLLVAGACGFSEADQETAPVDASTRQVEQMVDDEPADLLAAVRRASDRDGVRVRVTRSEDGGEWSYELVAKRDAWRVQLDAPDEGGSRATLLATGGELCFDRAFRPVVTGLVASSYGTVEFDREPWTCTRSRFGLNRLVTFDYLRQDPRWRMDHLTVDVPQTYAAEVVREQGESLLHVRTTGVTAAGPLDPERPQYELWVDADHRPVRMRTEGTTWDFERPPNIGDDLVPPPASRRGSYGYAQGPGQGVAKACRQSGSCPAFIGGSRVLLWGDGRR